MKLLFGAVLVLLIALSFLADYKWKQWMAARRHERDQNNTSNR